MAEVVLTSEILVKDAKLEAVVLKEEQIREMIEDTQEKQKELLKLKSVDQDNLKMVIQL